MEWASLFQMMCLCSSTTPPSSATSSSPAFYRVSGLHFAVSPLPIHRKPASSDPHQTSCQEVGPWKTSPERGGEECSGGGGPLWIGVVPSGGLTVLASWPPSFSPLPIPPTSPTSTQHSHIFALTIWQVFSTCQIQQPFIPLSFAKLRCSSKWWTLSPSEIQCFTELTTVWGYIFGKWV